MNLQDIVLPDIPTCYRSDTQDLISYINNILELDNQPRGDYKEFLELAKLILGETVERKKGYVFQIQRPGADHHARWMAKSIYIMKMALLLHQIPLHWTKKRNVQKMAHFVVFAYLRAWFIAPVLEAAATNDIRLFQSLQKYKSVDKKVSTITTTVLNRHTWYLTEELVPLSLFDEDLTLDQRTLLAARIGQQTHGVVEIKKPNLLVITKESELSEFVGQRSTVLFNLLNIPVTFLQDSDWHLRPEYSAVKKIIKNFSPLNDSCERALGMATRFNSKIARTEEGFDELMQVVEAHRRKFSVKTKSDLQSFY